MNEKRIVVIGSINMDLVVRCAHLPQAGETVLGGDFAQHPGGKGANQALAAAKVGGAVSFIGCVGDDAFGRQARAGLEHAGVDLSWLHTVANMPTGVAMVTVDDQGENCIALAPGANRALAPWHLDQAGSVIAGAAMLVCQLEVPLETVMHARAMAQRHGIPFLLNPAPATALSPAMLEGTEILVANRVEAGMLSGMVVGDVTQACRAAESLRRSGIASVVVTLGKDGAVVADSEGTWHSAALRVSAVDATGAGDTFVGNLATARVAGRSMADAVRQAQRAAAFSVTQLGGQASMPTASALAGFGREPMP